MAYLLGADGQYLLGADGDYLTDGVDPVSLLDVNETITSEYANSPAILALIDLFSQAADQTANINAFYDNVWNIGTAQGYGLDVLGRIVGVTRSLIIPLTGDLSFQGGDNVTFGQGPWYSSAFVGGAVQLDDDDFRTLILVKAAANISNCAAPTLNALLNQLFIGDGRVYTSNLGKMMMMVTFEFALTQIELAIITQSGVMPCPAGVQLWIQQIPDAAGCFGFAEAGIYSGFGQGTFAQIPTVATT